MSDIILWPPYTQAHMSINSSAFTGVHTFIPTRCIPTVHTYTTCTCIKLNQTHTQFPILFFSDVVNNLTISLI